MPYVELLIDKIIEVKKEKKLTNTEIGKLSDNATATVTRILNRQTSNPSTDTVIRMAIPLGISLDEAIGLKQPEDAPITSPVETALESYSELLKEKDERIAELKADKAAIRTEKNKLIAMLIAILAFVLVLLAIDLISGGEFGYFRY